MHDVLEPVGDPVVRAAIGDSRVVAVHVTVAAGDAERVGRDQQPRPVDDALLDRLPQRDVRVVPGADVAHRRESRLERQPSIPNATDRVLLRQIAHTGVLPLAFADRAPREMHVSVDEPWQQRVPSQVDHLGPVRDRQSGADADDLSLFDEHDRVGNRRAAVAVDQAVGADGDDIGLGGQGDDQEK